MRVACALLIAAACGPGADPGAAADADVETCAQLTSHLTDFTGGQDSTPVGFPAAPTGTQLCGTLVQASGPQAFYLAGSESSAALFAYYEGALTADNYTLEGPYDAGNGETTLQFYPGGAPSSQLGAISFDAQHLYFTVTYPPTS